MEFVRFIAIIRLDWNASMCGPELTFSLTEDRKELTGTKTKRRGTASSSHCLGLGRTRGSIYKQMDGRTDNQKNTKK